MFSLYQFLLHIQINWCFYFILSMYVAWWGLDLVFVVGIFSLENYEKIIIIYEILINFSSSLFNLALKHSPSKRKSISRVAAAARGTGQDADIGDASSATG